jgi:hypothetical protein
MDLVAKPAVITRLGFDATFFVADPCQWANDGQCDVPGACEEGDYVDCSAPSIAPSPPLAGRRGLNQFAPRHLLFGRVPGGTVALFRSAVVFAAALFDGMVDSVTARVGVTFDCGKDCRTATCAIDWSYQEPKLSSLPENIGLLSCRGRITKMCATPAYRSGSIPHAAFLCRRKGLTVLQPVFIGLYWAGMRR